MEVYLASENEDKKKEIQAYFPEWKILSPKDKAISFNPIEDGSSFLENALIKAKLLWDLVQKPVIADDSGICLSALDNRPGIHSARYTGKTQTEKNKNLIDELNALAKTKTNPVDRHCFYVCSLVYYYGENRYFSVQETLEGELIRDISEQKGCGGFGYDPIVYLPQLNKMVAELSSEEKNAISHRGKALAALKLFLSK